MNKRFIVGIALFFSIKNLAAIKKVELEIGRAPPVVVAVIDSGVDISHPDLRDNIWTNIGEAGLDSLGNDKSSNGVDDDDNGFVDDIHGWNFVDNSNRVDDSQGHGTHIAAIIKNEFKRKTVSFASSTLPQTVRLMILKYYDPKAPQQDNIAFSTRAIHYANKMGVQIINYSGGGYEKSATEFKAIQESQRRGILFIAAAGNSQANTDIRRYYPASYGLSNIISVAATTETGELGSFSNYGSQSVDIAAPGNEIRSALPNKKFGVMSGTSQATAFVSGAAAKILASKDYILKPQQTLAELLKSCQPMRNLAGKTKNQLALLN